MFFSEALGPGSFPDSTASQDLVSSTPPHSKDLQETEETINPYISHTYIYMCVCVYACVLYNKNPRNPKVPKVLHVLQWPSFCEVPLQQLLGNSWDLSVASDRLCEPRPSAWIAAGFAAFHLQASAWILGKSEQWLLWMKNIQRYSEAIK